MAARSRQILEAVQTALGAVDGTGGYTYDLSGSNAVVLFDGPPRSPPFVNLSAARGVSAEHGLSLGDYKRTMVVEVFGCVSGSDTPGDRGLDALDLADDITAALEADRSLGGLAVDLTVRLVGVAGMVERAPGLGACALEVEIYWYAHSGQGL